MKKRTRRTAAKSTRKPARSTPPSRTTSNARVRASASTNNWQSALLERIRSLIARAAPDAVEEIKWRKPSNGMRGVPVWSCDGIICTGETYKAYVKLTFARGAALNDPARLFNASLAGGTRRAIDIREGDALDENAFKALVRDAVALNSGK